MDESDDFGRLQKFSEFNMSVATLMRIDSLLCGLNTSFISGDVLLIHRGTCALFLEIIPFCDSVEDLGELGKINLMNEFQNIKKIINIKGAVVSYSSDSLDALISFQIVLRHILEKKGLLMAKTDNPMRALRG